MINLPQYIEILDFIENNLKTLKLEADGIGSKASYTFFIITLSHAQGIKFCLMHSAYPSAFALIRPVFESFMRGMWIAHCANDNQINKFLETGKIKPNFTEITKAVDKACSFDAGFTALKESVWDTLNDFTHTGTRVLHSNFNGSTLKQDYKNEDVNEVIDFIVFIAGLALMELLSAATSSDGERVYKGLIELIQKLPGIASIVADDSN